MCVTVLLEPGELNAYTRCHQALTEVPGLFVRIPTNRW